MDTKFCDKCNGEYPLTKEHWRIEIKEGKKKERIRYRCKLHGDAKGKIWRANNRERLLLEKKNHMLKKKFGLTLGDYNKMLEEQNGVCYICKEPEKRIATFSGFVQRLSVDHDHKTGQIRKILCNSCNLILGKVENSNISERFFQYLNEFKEEVVPVGWC